jgi:hypothetical protein
MQINNLQIFKKYSHKRIDMATERRIIQVMACAIYDLGDNHESRTLHQS